MKISHFHWGLKNNFKISCLNSNERDDSPRFHVLVSNLKSILKTKNLMLKNQNTSGNSCKNLTETRKISKNVPENSKMKIARNDRGKVRTSPQRPSGLPTTPQNINRAIYRRHLHCWCWNLHRRLFDLRLHRNWRCRPDIARHQSGNFVWSQEGRYGRVLTFTQQFLATLPKLLG